MKKTRNAASPNPAGDRLQKVLAAAGLGSRRDCEELITQGRVEVDRKVVTELGTRVDPEQHEIRVDGEALKQPKRVYFAVNKPLGVVTTNFDPSGRPRVIDLVPTEERVFAVGRLDRSSEGLILVTNDGEFANRLTHPRYGVEKTYLVRVAGAPNQQQLAKLKKGVHLAEGFAKAQSILVKKQHGQSTDMMIVLNEGRNREIRRILARVGHKVLGLKRVAVGSVKLGDMPPGAWRKLLPAEVQTLLNLATEKRRERRPAPAGKTDGTKKARPPAKASAGRDEPYVQKQALLSQPLSLDDLLSDDMDEGPLDGTGDTSFHSDAEDGGAPTGGVLDYEEFSPPASPSPAARPAHRGPRPEGGQRPRHKRPGGPRQRPSGGAPRTGKPRTGRPRTGGQGRGEQAVGEQRAGEQRTGDRRTNERRGGQQSEQRQGQARQEGGPQPRDKFGKKRGGKGRFGSVEGGRKPSGGTGGGPPFSPKHKKKKFAAASKDNQRRGERRGPQDGKPGGKRGGKKKGGR